MQTLRRETILLKLLVVPCDDLKLMVMRCLSKVPLSCLAAACGLAVSSERFL